MRRGMAFAEKHMLSGRKRQAPRGERQCQERCVDYVTTLLAGRMAMQVKTRVKAGGYSMNHTETLVRAKGPTKGLTVKTRVKAGGYSINHTETLVRATPRQRSRG